MNQTKHEMGDLLWSIMILLKKWMRTFIKTSRITQISKKYFAWNCLNYGNFPSCSVPIILMGCDFWWNLDLFGVSVEWKQTVNEMEVLTILPKTNIQTNVASTKNHIDYVLEQTELFVFWVPHKNVKISMLYNTVKHKENEGKNIQYKSMKSSENAFILYWVAWKPCVI